jgi:hypothetical protein
MTDLKGTIVISASLTFFTPEKVMNRKSLLLTAALSFAVAAPVFAQGGGGGAGVKTLPQDQTPGAVSAPGVGVGHAANGLPIGTPGSGTSNVDQK